MLTNRRVIHMGLSELSHQRRRGIQKAMWARQAFAPDCGIVNDAHRGTWHRQVSLLSYDKIEEFKRRRRGCRPRGVW